MTQASGRVERWFAAARRRVWVGLLAGAVLPIFGVGRGPRGHVVAGRRRRRARPDRQRSRRCVGRGPRQGSVTERFTKAIEQLGSDKLDDRIGGIYALERVARDSARDHPVVMEVVAAFLREHCRDEDATKGAWLREQLDCRGSADDAAGAVAGLTEVLDRMVRELGEDDPDTAVVRESLIHWREQVAQEPGPDTVRS